MCGDFNFLAEGDVPFTVNDPMRKRGSQAGTMNSQTRRLWAEALNHTVECQQDSPTHYNPAADSYSRLDRIYTTLAPWALMCSTCTARIYRDPRSLHLEGISDHAPVQMIFLVRRPLPKHLRPIPRETFELPGFQAAHDQILSQ